MFKRATIAITAIFIVIVSGYDGVGAQRFANPDCGPDVDMTFEDWRSWNRVNPTALLSKGHGDIYVDIYVDDLAKDKYLTASSPYPECSRIVKAQYTDETATKVDELTIMVKMPEGYDPEHNDWWYARYDPTGTEAIISGKMVTECRTCHEQASKTDYLFSKEVNAAASD